MPCNMPCTSFVTRFAHTVCSLLRQVISKTIVPGTQLEVSTVHSIRHDGATFECGSWAGCVSAAASSDTAPTFNLVYIDSMVQLDGYTVPDRDFEVGMVWCKSYTFSAQQLQAEQAANIVSFKSSRLIQLLQFARDKHEDSSGQFDIFPEMQMQERSGGGMWPWQAQSMVNLLTHNAVTFRPLYQATELDGVMRMTMR